MTKRFNSPYIVTRVTSYEDLVAQYGLNDVPDALQGTEGISEDHPESNQSGVSESDPEVMPRRVVVRVGEG